MRGNEQATKQSLIGPLFTILGYDLTDPRECVPEYRADFGLNRSVKPIDWAFLQNSRPIIFVEAKEAGRKLVGFDEQLADYFAKSPEAKLGILTNGLHWRFFTDIVHEHIMDREAFASWDVLADEEPPLDLLKLLQKSQYKAELVRTFAEGRHKHSLLVNELNRLLEPAPEFTRLAITNLETRNLTAGVVENWKPVLANAIGEWAKRCALSSILQAPSQREESAAENDKGSTAASKVETTQMELDGFARVQRLLGPDRPVNYEDGMHYFKVHHPQESFWAVCRFVFNRRRLVLWLPLPAERVREAAGQLNAETYKGGWSLVTLNDLADLDNFGSCLVEAWDQQWARRGNPPNPETTE